MFMSISLYKYIILIFNKRIRTYIIVMCLCSMRYPPYTDQKLNMVKRMMGKKFRDGSGIMGYIPYILIVAAIGMFLKVCDQDNYIFQCHLSVLVLA